MGARSRLDSRSHPETRINPAVLSGQLHADDRALADPDPNPNRRGGVGVNHDEMVQGGGNQGNQPSAPTDQDPTLRPSDFMSARRISTGPRMVAENPTEDQSNTSPEDLFLNLARSNSLDRGQKEHGVRSENGRVRAKIVFQFNAVRCLVLEVASDISQDPLGLATALWPRLAIEMRCNTDPLHPDLAPF